jgi:hypothetical protein
VSAQPWPEYEDERDRLERDAAADSRGRYLNLLGPLRKYLDLPGVQDVNVNGGDEGLISVKTDVGKVHRTRTDVARRTPGAHHRDRNALQDVDRFDAVGTVGRYAARL